MQANAETRRLREAGKPVREEVDLSQFQDPRSGEMLTRWDMIASPPDVLVTNYSMLNTIMMRSFESPMFDKTASWLALDERNVFTLVVDELHLYRGTQGSEVAMIVRSLLRRIGLGPDSPQLRIIGTSASLNESEGGLAYLEQFFGVSRSSFSVQRGKPADLPQPAPITRADVDVASRSVDELSRLVANACAEPDTARLRATSLEDVAARLFGKVANRNELLHRVLERLAIETPVAGSATGPLVPLRAHVFVRTPRGMWACSNPTCSGAVEPSEGRKVGQLFTSPLNTCTSCGSRVLELLYCYECGDVSLGGFVLDRVGQEVLLAPGPVTEGQSGKPVFLRPKEDYVWYRPGVLPLGKDWTKTGVRFAFAGAGWDAALGCLDLPAMGEPSGVGLTSSGAAPGDRIPALPTRCPNCGFDARQSDGAAFRAGQVRSPIRAHTSGLAAATQLYLSQLIRSLSEGREGRESVRDAKTIVFTDSRDDAARTAAGVSRNHHRDLVRQVLRREIHRAPDPVAVLDAMSEEQAVSAGLALAKAARTFQKLGITLPPEQEEALKLAYEALADQEAVPLKELYSRLTTSLVALGENPGGTSPWSRYLEDSLHGTTRWYRAFPPPMPGAWPEPPIAQGQEKLLRELRSSVIDATFDRARRDLESVGIARMSVAGVLSVPGPLAGEQQVQALESVIRLLGMLGRYEESQKGGVQPEAVMPPPVGRYLEAVAAQFDLPGRPSRDAVRAPGKHASSALRGFRLAAAYRGSRHFASHAPGGRPSVALQQLQLRPPARQRGSVCQPTVSRWAARRGRPRRRAC